MKKTVIALTMISIIAKIFGGARDALFLSAMGGSTACADFQGTERLVSLFFDITFGGAGGIMLIPALSRISKSDGKRVANRFAARYFTFAVIVCTAISAVMIIYASLFSSVRDFRLLMILVWKTVLLGATLTLCGYLNYNRDFATAAALPLISNLPVCVYLLFSGRNVYRIAVFEIFGMTAAAVLCYMRAKHYGFASDSAILPGSVTPENTGTVSSVKNTVKSNDFAIYAGGTDIAEENIGITNTDGESPEPVGDSAVNTAVAYDDMTDDKKIGGVDKPCESSRFDSEDSGGKKKCKNVFSYIMKIMPTAIAMQFLPCASFTCTESVSRCDGGNLLSYVMAGKIFLSVASITVFVLSRIIYPEISEYVASGKTETAKRESFRFAMMSAAVGLFVAVGFFLLGRQPIRLIFCRGAYDVYGCDSIYGYTRIMLLALPALAFAEISLKLIFAAGRVIFGMLSSVAATLAVIIVSTALGGGAAACGVSFVVGTYVFAGINAAFAFRRNYDKGDEYNNGHKYRRSGGVTRKSDT